ncbi:RING/U-box superfamily protein [Euphorbia peplus]|nr:RING/U-box superfamily protein [Euphorbia peplus]
MENSNSGNHFPQPRDQISSLNAYASNGKIMLFSGIILFIAIIVILCFHSYARWIFNLRRHRRHTLSLSAAAPPSSKSSQGLDPTILKALPVLTYTSKGDAAVLECAVCLSEFEEGEMGRVLPACKHTFHSCCIDMWFYSHSNCPLCRAPVKIGSDTVVPAVVPADLRKKGGNERVCSGSSPAGVSLPVVECRRIAPDLVGIIVEVPPISSGPGDSGCGPSGRSGPRPTGSEDL